MKKWKWIQERLIYPGKENCGWAYEYFLVYIDTNNKK